MHSVRKNTINPLDAANKSCLKDSSNIFSLSTLAFLKAVVGCLSGQFSTQWDRLERETTR
jgi:hypothetical protein